VKGDGNQQDYGMRVYDPRLGKFLSVDPLSGRYPFYTPYQFAGNKPIWAIDIDGLEPMETSTSEKPKEMGGVEVTSSNKGQKALNLITDRSETLWEFGYKWGGNLSNQEFTEDLRSRVLNPYGMDQGHKTGPGGGTNFCWVAAACSYQYQRDPAMMVNLMMDLYSNGHATIGSIDLLVRDNIRRAVFSNTFDNDGGLAGQAADQLLFLSIAANYKGYVNLLNSEYDPEDEDKTWASGNFNKFVGLLKAFGSNIVTAKGTDLGTSEVLGESAQTLMNAQNAGQTIFLYVYSAHFKEPPPDGSFAPSPSASHFVQVRNVQRNGNQFTMDYWDYGGWHSHKISLEGLRRATFGIVTTKD
jgi:hypothetical protein